MTLTQVVYRARDKMRRVFSGVRDSPNIGPFACADATADGGDLAHIFNTHEGHVVHKWVHYLPIYEAFLAKYRDTDFHMMEIGVSKGGSLQMWRRYFGPDATIFGIDIDPSCERFSSPPNQIRIGSQSDSVFLNDVVAEMGGLDVVLDDGSHVASHQRASFRSLWPLLSDQGLYMIEDTHTAYWANDEGGYRRPGTAIEFAKNLVDDMHHWYHHKGGLDDVGGVTFHDSIIVIQKQKNTFPVHVHVGGDQLQYPDRHELRRRG